MKFIFENIGPLRRADIELGDITVICGENNTGKTYAAYALYGFLKKVRKLSSPFVLEDADYKQLLGTGKLAYRYGTEKIAPLLGELFLDAGKDYETELADVLFPGLEKFSNARVAVEFCEDDFSARKRIGSTVHFNKDLSAMLQINVQKGVINVHLRSRDRKKDFPPDSAELRVWVSNSITGIFLKELFPDAFIASSMREGLTVFHDEISFAKDKLAGGEYVHSERAEAGGATFGSYSMPLRHNLESLVRFARARTVSLGSVVNEHPEILRDFWAILGGEYVTDDAGGVRFKPEGFESSLSLAESSASVRSLLITGLYLKFLANHGNILMVDEPESNLHPENQRRMARLFVRLANAGVKVFITTHSDYILKELELLILLNRDVPRILAVRNRIGYDKGQLLKASQLKVYIAEAPGIHDGAAGSVFTRAEISPESGVKTSGFDSAIDEMNSLFDEIAWGGGS
ncbi:MAG: ATP-binding protein [Synergistaceae bacterium]|nr:ATP-binding protein [Synergistaceae bacterium]